MSEQERVQKTAELAALKEQVKDVHGTKCLVFSRVVVILHQYSIGTKGKRKNFLCVKSLNVVANNSMCIGRC